MVRGDEMRDRGKPTVTVRAAPEDRDTAAENRENLCRVCGQLCSEANGWPTRVTVDWDAAEAEAGLA